MSRPDLQEDAGLPWRKAWQRDEVPLVLIRHGRTRHNLERRFVGRTDVPLDEVGRAQAQALGSRLASLERAALYASPLARTRQTAAPLGQPALEPDLQELDQGELEGLLGPEAFARYPDFFKSWEQDPSDVRVPGGETLRECQTRSVAALERIAARHSPERPVFIVTHQMVLASTVLHALGLPLRHLRLVRQKNTSINVLGWRKGQGLQVHWLNDHAHLGELG